jgi:uncharacterized OsmC-like protein
MRVIKPCPDWVGAVVFRNFFTLICKEESMYRASVENNGDMKFYATTKDYSFEMGINGEGANPVDTLLAGLCGCIGHYARDFMLERKIACNSFTVKAEARQTGDKTRLSEIDLLINLKSLKLEKSEEEALLKYVEQCKIYNTLKSGCQVNVDLVYL